MASRGLEEQLECPVCLERFDDPKLLPCQHTFCAHCLQNIEERGNVMCPECRAEHQVPAAGFPNNITMQRLLSASLMPNVPSLTIEPSFARVQPTAPPIEPSTSRGIQPAVYTLNAPQQPPPWQPGHLTNDYNGYHGNAAPYESTRPQPRTQPFANFQAARASEPRIITSDDDWQAMFLKYFRIIRKAIRKVVRSFLGSCKGCMTIITILFLQITFSRFVAGAVKLSSDCYEERRVAQYLFVKSWFAFLFWITLALLRCKKKLQDAMDNLFIEVYVVVVEALFSLIWLIVGSVWTIGFRDEMKDKCPFHVNDWNDSFITFAMVLVVFDWLAVCAFLFYSCYVQFDNSDEEDTIT